jgi:flagellar biosynthesis protein FlhA
MPNLAFLALATLAMASAYLLSSQQERAAQIVESEVPAMPAPTESRDLSWDDVAPVDLIGLEVGYRLIPLVDRNQGGELMARIKGVRKKISQDLGFLVQAVHIRDNLDLAPNAYRITLKGVPVGEAEIYPER